MAKVRLKCCTHRRAINITNLNSVYACRASKAERWGEGGKGIFVYILAKVRIELAEFCEKILKFTIFAG